MNQYRLWTEEETAMIRRWYPVYGKKKTAEIMAAAGFARTPAAVGSRAKVLKLKAPTNGRFQPGQPSHNKGAGMDPETRKKVRSTWFRPGHLPHTTLQDGAVTVRRETSTGLKYKWIRVALGKWELYHRWLWKKHRGQIPKGMVVSFQDNDQMNCCLDNLILISRADNLARMREKTGGTPAENLTDNYVASLLAKKGLPRQDISQELIELERARLLLNREIKK